MRRGDCAPRCVLNTSCGPRPTNLGFPRPAEITFTLTEDARAGHRISTLSVVLSAMTEDL